MKKILIIEDDIEINEMITRMLQRNNYQTVSAFSGSEALLYLAQSQVDLILLDLMLPGKTGEQVLEEYKNIDDTPIIVLTAISDTQSITTLLRKGANDYIIKPFDYDELLARIEVQLRRQKKKTIKETTLTYKDLLLNLNLFKAFINGNEIAFSKRDFLILQTLLENPNQVFTKEALYTRVWGEEYFGDDNTINVHISNIRKKISEVSNEEYIETIWGIGVKLHS